MSNKYFQILKEYSIVALACIVMAFNINYFFLANKLAEGGIAGISLIIHYLTHKYSLNHISLDLYRKRFS